MLWVVQQKLKIGLLIALDQNYITQEQYNELDEKLTEIIKMLIGCIKRE